MKESLLPALAILIFISFLNLESRSQDLFLSNKISLERHEAYRKRNLDILKEKHFPQIGPFSKEGLLFCREGKTDKIKISSDGSFNKTPIRNKLAPQPKGYFLLEGDEVHFSWLSGRGELESFRVEYILSLDNQMRPESLTFDGEVYRRSHCN